MRSSTTSVEKRGWGRKTTVGREERMGGPGRDRRTVGRINKASGRYQAIRAAAQAIHDSLHSPPQELHGRTFSRTTTGWQPQFRRLTNGDQINISLSAMRSLLHQSSTSPPTLASYNISRPLFPLTFYMPFLNN
ncbi:hypothetical protein H6P81_012273 [Aristolochia fimbriata]|uniref:Uncharacterized protein n=1 Tax=Aristolochia fimbriata TaxID=158543 RepID=A0AAV7EBC0_ARIFI|nr:hypothetical protein H6P81_012273 [Aristolochia fimbriata]